MSQREKNIWSGFATEPDFRNYIASGVPADDENYFKSGFDHVSKLILNDNWFYSPLEKNTCYELGCGDGRMTLALSKIYKRVYAVDIVQKFLERAKVNADKYKIRNITLKLFNQEDINDFKCDRFFSYIVLQHNTLDSIQRTLSAVNLSLKEGAKFKVQVRSQEIPINSPFWGYVFRSQEEIKGIFLECGFNVERVEGLGVRYCWVWGTKCKSA